MTGCTIVYRLCAVLIIFPTVTVFAYTAWALIQLELTERPGNIYLATNKRLQYVHAIALDICVEQLSW